MTPAQPALRSKMMEGEDWKPIASAPDKRVVETKIDDGKGVRNLTTLKRSGNLWWFPDGSMYVYYSPTHWREINHVR